MKSKVKLFRLCGVLFFVAALAFVAAAAAGDGKDAANKKAVDDPSISSDVHAPLFKTPDSEQAAALTAHLTAGLDRPEMAPVPRVNFIDDHIFGKMEQDGIPHAPLSSDGEFVRRVYLDLAGRVPQPDEVYGFLADTSEDKRARLIDHLIDSDHFVDKWSYFLMDTLRVQTKTRGFGLFHEYLKQSLAADRPYDDLASSIMSSAGKSNMIVAAVNVIVREHVEGHPGQVDHGDDHRKIHQMDTHDELSIQFGKVFLGINMSCVSCHDGRGRLDKVNVYLSGRTREDFFRNSAFMGQTRYVNHVERTEVVMGHVIVDDLGPGYNTEGDTMLRVPRYGGENSPKFMLTDELPEPGKHLRSELARMLTSHPQFARATTNLFWSKLMGFGIVEPVDEFDLARQDPDNVPEGWVLQPSHPELLNELAVYFRENNHSIKKLFRLIANSSTYQLSSRFPTEWSDNYTKYFARKYVRMLTAEELHDAIALVTGRPGDFRNGTVTVPMAMQASFLRPRGELQTFMQAFGHSNRTTVARPPIASPLQPIIMMQSPVVRDRVLAEKDGRVQTLLESEPDDGKLVNQLFMWAVSREPSAEEKKVALEALAEDRLKGAENLQWALLNLAEFLYNF